MQRLKVLLFISAEADAVEIHHELTTQLAHYMSKHADVRLVTGHDKDSTDLTGCHLLHIFGSWSHSASHLMLKAHRQHVPTVFTPLGGLQPWVMRHHKPSRLFAYQRRMTTLASAVHVCGKLEGDTFAKLGWNKRMALIKNPVLTSQLTFDAMTVQMLALYRKVLDSNARLLLNADSCVVIGQLLALSIDKDILRDHERCDTLRQQLARLTEDDWRRVFIYSADEQIEQNLLEGLSRIQFIAPQTITANVVRFTPDERYNQGSLKDYDTYSRNILMRNKLDEAIAPKEQRERRLIIQLLNLRHELEHHKAPLLHLADIYHTMRFTDMDEDRLNEIARDLGIDDFAARIMAVMHEVMGLTEGFMPFASREGRATQRLTNDITKYNT